MRRDPGLKARLSQRALGADQCLISCSASSIRAWRPKLLDPKKGSMAGNQFGERFLVSTFGESHGGAVGVVVDGCPAGLEFPLAAIQAQLSRRRPGQGRLTTQRKEADEILVQSGVDPQSGQTLGTPIAMWVHNKDAKSGHYDDMQAVYRPSHADFTYDARYGLRAVAGGGRSSARETVGRVAAGALAENILAKTHGVEIVAWVEQIGDVCLASNSVDEETVNRALVDAHELRCPCPNKVKDMETSVLAARKDGDSIGGVVRAVIRNVPPGWGEPVFDKLSAELAYAMMSLPASRSFELGEGRAAAAMRGSAHNDPFVAQDGKIRTSANRSGGIQGGISNGAPIRFSVAFKPVATIFQEQDTVTRDGTAVRFTPKKGRHDPCVVARAVPMVESMAALVLCDHLLRSQGIRLQDLC